jgi:hypothetical protein
MPTLCLVLLVIYLSVGCFLALLTGAYRSFNRREWLMPVAVMLWPFLLLMLIVSLVGRWYEQRLNK